MLRNGVLATYRQWSLERYATGAYQSRSFLDSNHEEFAMRKLFGCLLALGFMCSVTLAQNVEPGRQSGAAGQKQGEPAGQGDTVRGQVPGQTQQGQAAQGLNQGQQGFQQGQAGQQGGQQFGQQGQS